MACQRTRPGDGHLRAIDYGALPVAAFVVLEALLLALIDALPGAAIAWLLFDGQEIMVDENVYPPVVMGDWLHRASCWRWHWHCLGSLPPAIRAGRLQVIQALRAQ